MQVIIQVTQPRVQICLEDDSGTILEIAREDVPTGEGGGTGSDTEGGDTERDTTMEIDAHGKSRHFSTFQLTLSGMQVETGPARSSKLVQKIGKDGSGSD